MWPNYSTDYSPVVYFAKENKIPDFLRWGCLGDALRAAQAYIESWYPDANEYINASTLQSWDPVSWASSNYVAGHNFVDGKHELYPIPLAEIQSNAALNGQNNPGFE